MADDDPRLKPGTPENEEAKRARRGHPSGSHIREHDDDGPPRMSEYLREGRTVDLRDLVLHANSSAAPKPDAWKWIGGSVAVIGLIITIVVQGSAIVQSNQSVAATNQKFIDRVEAMDDRLHVVEKRQVDNLPRIDQQASENKMQNDRINSIVESLAEERKQRGADSIESRKAMQDIMALIGRYADKLADIDKSVAVMQSGGRRSEIAPPVRDAQVMQGR